MTNPQGGDKPASVETCPDCARLRLKNQHMRRALRDLNKTQRARADATRELHHIPYAQRHDYLLADKGKLTQRNNELRKAIGPVAESAWQWPDMLSAVARLAAEVETLRARAKAEQPLRVAQLIAERDAALSDLAQARETIARLEGELTEARGSLVTQSSGPVSSVAAPIAAVEPRAIVVGATWFCPGHDVLVMSVESGMVLYLRPGKWISSLPDAMFRDSYAWISDPEPPSTGGEQS